MGAVLNVERAYDTASPFCEFSEFVERHGLTLQLRRVGGRYIADLADVYVRNASCLLDRCGDGATEDEAVLAYARRLSGKALVLHASQPAMRRDVSAPFLVHTRMLAGRAS